MAKYLGNRRPVAATCERYSFARANRRVSIEAMTEVEILGGPRRSPT